MRSPNAQSTKLRNCYSGSENHADAVKLLKRRIKEMGTGKPFGVDVDRTTLGDLVGMLEDDYQANGHQLSTIKAQLLTF